MIFIFSTWDGHISHCYGIPAKGRFGWCTSRETESKQRDQEQQVYIRLEVGGVGEVGEVGDILQWKGVS
jgi:hypothetical protein